MLQYSEYNMVVRSKTLKIGEILIANILTYEDLDSLHIFKHLLKDQSSNIQANYSAGFVSWIGKLTEKLK